MDTFRAFRITNEGGQIRGGIVAASLEELTAGGVVIKTGYSSVNYKDALAATGTGRILRRFPLIGGIDAAGVVVSSADAAVAVGTPVLVTGYDLGVANDGGYAEYVRVPAEWVVPLPSGLTAFEAMTLGTAGFTAALAIVRLEQNGLRPGQGPVVVTGATGGVGMLAVDIFSRAGFEVHAISGKADRFDFLRALGAHTCLDRRALAFDGKAMDSVRFGGALDTVGGEWLAGLLARTAPYGNVASCGLAASAQLPTTVMPFIIRGVSLLGIASAGTARDIRAAIWARLASDWRPRHLDAIATGEVGLEELPGVFESMLAGRSFGRTVVRLAADINEN
jgi:putative YhdH/YhfP family quinone oxidoreductase